MWGGAHVSGRFWQVKGCSLLQTRVPVCPIGSASADVSFVRLTFRRKWTVWVDSLATPLYGLRVSLIGAGC